MKTRWQSPNYSDPMIKRSDYLQADLEKKTERWNTSLSLVLLSLPPPHIPCTTTRLLRPATTRRAEARVVVVVLNGDLPTLTRSPLRPTQQGEDTLTGSSSERRMTTTSRRAHGHADQKDLSHSNSTLHLRTPAAEATRP